MSNSGTRFIRSGVPISARAGWLTLFAFLLGMRSVFAASLQVGWATVDLTPDLSNDRQTAVAGLLIPRYTSEIVSRVTATALALERVGDDGVREQAVLVSCDLPIVSFMFDERPSPLLQLRERLHERLKDLDGKKIFLMATHAHSTPVYDENQFARIKAEMLQPSEYLEFLLQKLIVAVETAWANRQPGGFTWGLGHAVVGINRRVVYPNGRAVMGGWRNDPHFDHIEGPNDHGVEMLFFWTPAHRLTGVLINVACPSQADSQALFISADFWGSVRKRLRQHPEFADVAILPQTGASGDQWPTHHTVREKAESAMQQRRGGLSRADEMGRRIANTVLDVYPYSKDDVVSEPLFRHRVVPMRLPYRILTAAEADDIRQQYDRLQADVNNPFRHTRMHEFRRLLERYAAQANGVPQTEIEVHAIRLGDVAIVTNPFELYVDYGMRIKARSPAVLTLTSQLSAEVTHSEVYLATARAVAAGGYSADALWYNHVGPDGGQILVDRTVDILSELWKPQQDGGAR